MVVANTAHEIAYVDLPLSAIKERAASRTRFVVIAPVGRRPVARRSRGVFGSRIAMSQY